MEYYNIVNLITVALIAGLSISAVKTIKAGVGR